MRYTWCPSTLVRWTPTCSMATSAMLRVCHARPLIGALSTACLSLHGLDDASPPPGPPRRPRRREPTVAARCECGSMMSFRRLTFESQPHLPLLLRPRARLLLRRPSSLTHWPRRPRPPTSFGSFWYVVCFIVPSHGCAQLTRLLPESIAPPILFSHSFRRRSSITSSLGSKSLHAPPGTASLAVCFYDSTSVRPSC